MHTQDIERYQHPHIFHYSGEQAERRTMRVVLLTVVMMVVEIAAGWLFGSMALFADGWHMSTHAAALGISWLAFVIARRCAGDQRFAFGTWKIEILGGFVSAIILGLVGLAMAAVSLHRLLAPVDIQFNQAILVAGVGLAVNVASVALLKDCAQGHAPGHSHHGHAHAAGNLNLRAAYLHVVADALTSVLAIAALLGAKWMRWMWLDPLMGIVGAILILRWTRSLLADTGRILLDREASADLAAAIRSAVETDDDGRISDLHVWRVGQDRYACIIALVAHAPRPLADYKSRLHAVPGLVHVTVEITTCPRADSAH